MSCLDCAGNLTWYPTGTLEWCAKNSDYNSCSFLTWEGYGILFLVAGIFALIMMIILILIPKFANIRGGKNEK